ncbi:hypothetical protein D4F22_21630 [Escherichia coli]|nr:hypothetical protein [Escherichia coli]
MLRGDGAQLLQKAQRGAKPLEKSRYVKEVPGEENDFCGGIANHYPTYAGFSSYCGICRCDHGCCSCCKLCEYRKPTGAGRC